MCLIGIRLGNGPHLTIAANRDEFAHRPTAPMHWWQEDFLAGKDLQAGGTWLGVSRAGRFAAVTNVRDPALREAPVPQSSRGLMVSGFLSGADSPQNFLEGLLGWFEAASPFNLIVGQIGQDQIDCWYLSGRTRTLNRLEKGAHVLSNAELNTPWPKAQRLLEAMRRHNPIQESEAIAAIESVMHSQGPAQDHELPETGVPYAWEKRLSAAFITGSDYHTRSSTLIQITQGEASARELTWSPDGRELNRIEERFSLLA